MSFRLVLTKISFIKTVDLKKAPVKIKLGFSLMKKLSVPLNLLDQVGFKNKLSLNGLISQKNYLMF